MKTAITVRIESELLAATRTRARDENRSLTNYIETLLKQHLKITPLRAAKGPLAPQKRSRNAHVF